MFTYSDVAISNETLDNVISVLDILLINIFYK